MPTKNYIYPLLGVVYLTTPCTTGWLRTLRRAGKLNTEKALALICQGFFFVAGAGEISNFEWLKDLKMIFEYIKINDWNFLFLVYLVIANPH